MSQNILGKAPLRKAPKRPRPFRPNPPRRPMRGKKGNPFHKKWK